MKSLYLLFSCLLFSAVLGYSQKEEVLTNKSIVDLTKAGMTKKIILSKIETSTCKFSTETQSLITLKKGGVDDEIIDAMVAKMAGGGAAAPAPKPAPQQSSPAGDEETASYSTPVTSSKAIAKLKGDGSGIYYVQPSNGEVVELDPTVFSQSKSNAWAAAWSYGFAKTKKVMSVSGGTANVQFSIKKPVFYFYFDPENKSLNSQAPTWFAAVTSPNEFLIIKFNTKVKNSRAVTTASSNAYESAAGIDDEFKRAFKFKKIEKGIYEVYFENDLEPGEYGFMYAGASATNGGASPKVYDFGVK